MDAKKMYDLPSQLQNVKYDTDGRPLVDVNEFKNLINSGDTGFTRNETGKLVDALRDSSNPNLVDLFKL